MRWKHYQVGRGLVWYPSTNSSLQFDFPSLPDLQLQHFIFSSIYLSFGIKYLFPKMPKNHPKIYTKPPNSGYGYKHKGQKFSVA